MPNISLPYLTKANGVSDAAYGYALSLSGILQVIGAPIFGSLIKSHGVKKTLYLCFTSNLIMMMLLCFSQDNYSLFLSRLPAFFIHPPTAYQTLLSRLTSPGPERTKAFGRFGFTIGFGLIVAPVFAQIFNSIFGLIGSFIGTSVICILAFLLTMVYIEEPVLEESTKEKETSKTSTSPSNAYMTLLSRPNVLRTLIRKTLVGVPILVSITIIQLHMINKFKMDQSLYAIYQFANGTSLMLINAFGVAMLRKRLSEPKLLLLGGVFGLLTMFQFCYWESLWQLIFIVPFLTSGISITNVVADSIITSSVRDEEQSLILGLLRSIETSCRTIGPAVGGYILQHYGFGLLGFIGAISTIGSILVHFI
uniref:Major facilitator superfamily (MFS) profile domain-containing protein n=1 Tax=Acrobeloides nanus TaxID=290746 RepID=A0A914EHX1_9BILA